MFNGENDTRAEHARAELRAMLDACRVDDDQYESAGLDDDQYDSAEQRLSCALNDRILPLHRDVSAAALLRDRVYIIARWAASERERIATISIGAHIAELQSRSHERRVNFGGGDESFLAALGITGADVQPS